MKIKKIKQIKKYQQDIWGLVVEKGKYQAYTKKILEESSNKRDTLSTLVLKGENVIKRKKALSLYGKLLVLRKKLCLFYGDLRYSEYKKIAKKSENSLGNYATNIINNLENRLDVLVYRMHFTRSVKEARDLIKQGGVLVDKQVVKIKSYKVKEGQILEIAETHKEKIHELLKFRVEQEDYFMGVQKNIEVNYEILAGCLVSKIKVEDVGYPFKVSADYFTKENISRIS